MEDRDVRRRLFLRTYIEQFAPVRRTGAADEVMLRVAAIERVSISRAKKAIDMAISDIVDDCDDLPLEVARRIDMLMLMQGAATLSELRVERSRRLKAILRRGKIRDEFDYFLGKGIIDSDSAVASGEVKSRLVRLVDEYESAIRK